MSKSQRRTAKILKACLKLPDSQILEIVKSGYREKQKERIRTLNRIENEARLREFNEDCEHGIIKL